MPSTKANTGTAGAAGSSWTEKDKLVYLFALLESSGRPDFKNTPLPPGRSLIACQRMYDRMKTGFKDEIEALKNGVALPSSNGDAAAGKKGAGAGAGAGAGRKRKLVSEEAEDTPKKKGPKTKKVKDDEEEIGRDNEQQVEDDRVMVKLEMNDEEEMV